MIPKPGGSRKGARSDSRGAAKSGGQFTYPVLVTTLIVVGVVIATQQFTRPQFIIAPGDVPKVAQDADADRRVLKAAEDNLEAAQAEKKKCSEELSTLRQWYEDYKAEKELAAKEGSATTLVATAGAEGGEEANLQQELRRRTRELDLLKKDHLALTEKHKLAIAQAEGYSNLLTSDGSEGDKGSNRLDSRKLKAELQRVRRSYNDLQLAFDRVLKEKAMLETMSGTRAQENFASQVLNRQSVEQAKKLVAECGKLSAGGSGLINAKGDHWKLYNCRATKEDLRQYLDYKPRSTCPDDWFFVQELIYGKDCFALPKRRCLNRTPRTYVPPVPFPRSLFSQSALENRNVRWDLHNCKSFECLNSRSLGDCRNCFNMTLESHRWKSTYRGSLKMKDVIEMKKGTLRIGLDVGGGSGSFAAHMALYNVTIMTTAYNVETVVGRMTGLPYMETIALRGLIPLHSPHKARLPLFDNTLDIVHCVNSVKYLPMLEFEELIFEWDRILRPGGVIWFEMFYAPVSEMPMYVTVIGLLGYKKLYWNMTPKPDAGERGGAHVYLNCLLEKPNRKL